MSRGRDRDEQDGLEAAGSDSRITTTQGRVGGSGTEDGPVPERPESDPTQERGGQRDVPQPNLHDRERRQVPGRERSYRLRDSEMAALTEVGRFRTVRVEDLAQHHYQGNAARMAQDLRSLVSQGLLMRRTVPMGRNRQQKITVLVLSREGKRVIEKEHQAGNQALYAGLVKPGEVVHDAAIYRMYQAEAQKIESQGGRVQRVVLDYELKKNIYSALQKPGSGSPDERAHRQQRVAEAHGLKVVEGKIPLPDLRLEYETREGELAKVDLELATEHYKSSQVGEKAQAGFTIYVAGQGSARMSAVLEEREITAGILSL